MCTLLQELPLVSGVAYRISYAVQNLGPATGNQWQAFFAGTPVDTLLNMPTSTSWRQRTITARVPASASSNQPTNLTFEFRSVRTLIVKQ
jgi:hypothetical protein